MYIKASLTRLNCHIYRILDGVFCSPPLPSPNVLLFPTSYTLALFSSSFFFLTIVESHPHKQDDTGDDATALACVVIVIHVIEHPCEEKESRRMIL